MKYSDKGFTKSIFLVFVCVASLLPLQACDFNKMFLSTVFDDAEVEEAKEIINNFFTTDYESVQKILDPSFFQNLSEDHFKKIKSAMPQESVVSAELIGGQFNTFYLESGKQTNKTYHFQYEYPQEWRVITLALSENSKTLITGIHISHVQGDLKETHKFTLVGKPIQNYIILLAAIVFPIFIIISLVMCYKTPIPQKKWLWYIFIAIGLGGFQLNWTTGAWGFQPVYFYILGSGFSSFGPYSPTIILMGLPVGALLFQIKRYKWGW